MQAKSDNDTMKRTASILESLLLSLALAVLLPAALSAGTHRLDRPPVILVIHSYNPEYRWTTEENKGIVEALASISTPYTVYSEYLDWKRFPDEANIARMAALYAEKYRTIPIDVIITADDKALEFAVDWRKKLFSNAPVVFTGVYRESLPGLVAGEHNFTGIYEDQDILNTLRIAFNVQPGIRKAYLLNDTGESGRAIENSIRDELARMTPEIPVTSLSGMPIEAVEDFVSGLGMQDLLFIGTYSIEKGGRSYAGETLIGRVAMAAGTPLYVLNTHQLGTGAFGGSLLDPVLLGRNAGNLAIRILEGERADDIPPQSERVFTPLFDYATVKRLDIPMIRLPVNAAYLNREIPFIVRYRTEAIFIAAAFLVLLVCLYTVLINLRRVRRLAKELSARNEEITLLNDTLQRTDDRLRKQYAEISEIKEHLETSEERYRLALVGSNDAVWDWDVPNRTTLYSDRWYEITGYDRTKNGPVVLGDIIHRNDRDRYDETVTAHIQRRTDCIEIDVRIRTASGAYKWVRVRGKAIFTEEGEPARVAGSVTDIDDQKRKEEEIENLAYYDQLTSIPNRALAIDTARTVLEQLAPDAHCGLMHIDIDNFKYVNDTYGHAVGDQILIRTAQVLASLLNENTHIARIGGDEFVMLVAHTEQAEMEKFAKLVIRLLSRKMEISGRIHFLTVSVGIALYPEHATGYEELFQKADAALYRAKTSGKTRFQMFDTSIQKELVRRMELEGGLRTAVETNELYVMYQPLVNARTGKVDGIETLARWYNPRLGEISPAEFIPIAEESGQIDQIGFFILRTSMRFLKRADSVGHHDVILSVNISVKQMQESDFVLRLVRLAKDEEVPPGRIALEITESFLIESLDPVIERLNELKAAGFLLSLDDFGKGYSSLSYLKTIPLNYIKIDKSFIDEIISNKPGVPLAQAIIDISHQLGLKVVAEGVESTEQLDYLRSNNCDFIQGYYYSRPVREDTILDQLRLSFD